MTIVIRKLSRRRIPNKQDWWSKSVKLNNTNLPWVMQQQLR